MLRKILAVIILVPLAILIIAFAVANRHVVTVSFDPFAPAAPAAVLTVPLFVLVIVLLIAGVIIGGAASWLQQGKWRGAARRIERDAQVLRGRIAVLEADLAKPTIVPQQAEPPPRLRLRPPVR